MKCRFCSTDVYHEFADLVNSPASNSFLTRSQLNEAETYYPLKVFVCHNCFLVQVDEYKRFDSIFDNNYAYFSSFSTSWLTHCKIYTNNIIEELRLSKDSQVVEIASNDGYLLQYFLERQIKVLGIEPTKNTADIAILKGIPCITEFFGLKLANQLVDKGIKADLLIGNNVLAHVPNINDFVSGLKRLLSDSGVITLEFPHLIELVKQCQFDTIYHEHFSYLSLYTTSQIFKKHGLEIYKVDRLPTHGGSIRIYARHDSQLSKIDPSYNNMIKLEKEIGVNTLEYYSNFQLRILNIKFDLVSFLIENRQKGKRIVAYGAAAKGNTLLNYCGIKKDLIEFVVDANPAKINKFLPASHIPVLEEGFIKETQPDFILLLPWNLKEELTSQLSYARDWGCKFVIPIPELSIF